MPTTAELVARRLAEAGCRTAFGLPGGEVLTLMQALHDAGLRFVLVKHENAGALMAEGVHAIDGAPGVLLVTLGPGLANAVNAVINALQEQVPLIVVSGCVGPAAAATYTHQVFDHRALMAPLTKGSFTLVDGAVDVLMDRAVALALADPPGPVHVDVPVDLATKPQPDPRRVRVPAAAPMAPAESAALTHARDRLARAQRPLLIAGMGAVQHEAGPAIRALAERFGAPVVTTYKAKGLLPEDHPLALGGHGLSPRSDAVLLPLIASADCLVLAGYDPIEMRVGWTDPWDPDLALEFTHQTAAHGVHGARSRFVGHIRASLEALIADLAPAAPTWSEGAPAEARVALQARFAPPHPWGPHQVFATARAHSPAETLVTADSGAHRILLSQMWTCPRPRAMLQSSAFCTMGSAVPLALGAKLAAPHRPVLAVVGDAGLEMGLGELATARDLGLPIVVLVLVDASLALIALKQRRLGLPNLGVDFAPTDFAAVAEALGGVGRTITSAPQLADELQQAYRRDAFTVLACAIERGAYEGAI